MLQNACYVFGFLCFVAIVILVYVDDFKQTHVWDEELNRYIELKVALMRQMLRNAQQIAH